MRNPLNSIISNCDMLCDDLSITGESRKKLKTMQISCNLLTSFCNDLIDWTQIKMDKFNKKLMEFDLKETFKEITEMMRFKAELKGIYCHVQFEGEIPRFVKSDKSRLM